MSAEWGALREPTAYVPPEPESSPGASRTPSPGEWDESLGQYGAEEWELPGLGESAPRCGEYYITAVCTEAGHIDAGTHQCGRRSCPECWGRWAAEAAVRASVRLQAARYQQPDDYRRQAAHAVVSPPEGEIMTARGYWEGRSTAAEIAKEKGFRGFSIMPHPYRVTEAGKDAYRAADPDYGIWVWLRNDVDDLDRYTYWSPHYHVVGLTSADMDPAKDSDEWVYKFERSLTRFEGIRDTEANEDVYGLYRYLASHTGYPEGSTKQTVTWYGDLANAVFVEEATEDWQNPKPSEGVMSALQRELEELAGIGLEDDRGEGDPEADELGECEVEGCEGLLIDVFDVRAYLETNDPPREVSDRMLAAYEWRIGDRKPPPGLKAPRTEAELRESFEALL